MNRQADGDIIRQTNRQIDKQSQIDKHISSQVDKSTGRMVDRQKNRQIDRKTLDIRTYRQSRQIYIYIVKQTDRQINIYTDRLIKS